MSRIAEAFIVVGMFIAVWADEGFQAALHEWRLYRKETK